ncbi:MAG TPA: HD domain-containing protein [Rubrobacter sp.]|nr:HD domain-containing protein [Rubrobacter sp.]
MRASFLATDITVRKDSRGVPYLSMKLVDSTGSVDARMWGKLPEEFLNETPAPAYVDVEGHTHEYRGTLQVKLERLRLLRPEDVSEEDYLPATEMDRRVLAAELERAGQELENEHLRELFEKMVSDEDFWTAFCEAPAAKTMHHARIGGLLEHSVSCLKIARELAELYPVDRDLLVFGAIFHDVGKVRELSWDKGAFAYTTEGRMLGHVVLGERLVSSYVESMPAFPEELRLRLSHVLISHQGETEYGSPERPTTLEALLVHLVDNLDARAAMYVETTINVSPGGWSHHENPLGRALYVPEE